jgi:hypothetical protein
MSDDTKPKEYSPKQTLAHGEPPVLPEGHMIIGRKLRRKMESQNRLAVKRGLPTPHKINLINVKRTKDE